MPRKKVLRGHPRFYEILEELRDLHDRKNNNYAEDSDPLSNLRECERMGLPPYMGVFVRLGDKYSRIAELAKGKPDLVGESIFDTLKDNAIYSILGMILYEEYLQSLEK